jgi:3-hydroxybutyryl-CoA dehydrogenase
LTIDDRPQVMVEAVPERADLAEPAHRKPRRSGQRLASNTSSISIDSLGVAPLGTRTLCLHFNPVWAMALLEIVVGAATEEPTA